MRWQTPGISPRRRNGTRAIASRQARVHFLVLGLVTLLTNCASTNEHVYKLYGGPPRPDAEVATVQMGDAAAARIDDRAVSVADYGYIKVLPGAHRIAWECVYGVSVMIEPSGFATGEGAAGIELEAGHVYALRCDRTTGPGYQTYQWIVDETAKKIVAGERKP